jgi:hypothetical protein
VQALRRFDWPAAISTMSLAGPRNASGCHDDEFLMTNYVVEFEPGRRIAWEPVLSAASRAEDVADIGTRAGHVWSFRLEADGPTTTVVTEIFDCTRSPDWLKKAVKGGTRWTESMTATLARLDEQCATRMTRDDVVGDGVRPTASEEKAAALSRIPTLQRGLNWRRSWPRSKVKGLTSSASSRVWTTTRCTVLCSPPAGPVPGWSNISPSMSNGSGSGR